jgi:hypothetical protein
MRSGFVTSVFELVFREVLEDLKDSRVCWEICLEYALNFNFMDRVCGARVGRLSKHSIRFGHAACRPSYSLSLGISIYHCETCEKHLHRGIHGLVAVK